MKERYCSIHLNEDHGLFKIQDEMVRTGAPGKRFERFHPAFDQKISKAEGTGARAPVPTGGADSGAVSKTAVMVLDPRDPGQGGEESGSGGGRLEHGMAAAVMG
ncbi:MAG TPA: hypothetical protein VK943_07515, partial [Arenibaculum sp.]|nr:hypothetical protein [Arenibaculum sp.]